MDKIERCELDGSNRVIISRSTPQHPFDIAVYGDYLFWTDWMLRAVVRINKYSGEDVVWLRKDVPRPMGIVAVAEDVNTCTVNPCHALNGGCEDKCMLDASGKVVCGCSKNRVLDTDQKRCVTKKIECDNKSFKCDNGVCIPYNMTCDGINHCSNGEDESLIYCASRKCKDGFFQCRNNRCILSTFTCNGINNCGDQSDEVNCSCSMTDQFQCGTGQCIAKWYRCDFDPDCDDASDEIGCPPRNCSRDHLDRNTTQCPSTTGCIDINWFCDGENDCWDNSDEVNCTSKYSIIILQTLEVKNFFTKNIWRLSKTRIFSFFLIN